MEIVQHGGYPELRVEGQPFFIHSAAFFYYRIPRDLWEAMLNRYHALGINTIDIYIPWNWHEPKEGEFDFDGHTNPRRDLRSLLTLITNKGFRLIARPGPEILNEWRHGGYPGWLLERPEYKMDPLDWIEGRYPPLDNLNTRDAEAAAQGWLENPTHMEQTRIWLTAVAKILAPYGAHATVHVKSENRQLASGESSGPLLFVQLGDDFAIGRANRAGPQFWKYVEELRGMLAGGGLNVPAFINPTDMRVSAQGASQNPAIGVMGQWYMPREPASENAGPALLTSHDTSEIGVFTEELKTQPAFPPVMVEYQAGWYAPADDDRPRPNLPENTLLSSRLLIGNGIHGFNYFPLQDTFTPAGYSVPWANRSYRWDAALSPDGDPQPRIQAVRRNGQLLQTWGSLLAASHKRPDFGIIYPLGAYAQNLLTPQDISTVSESVMRIERLGVLATVASELLDPEFQPVEQLLRDPLLFLPVFDAGKPQFQLSERAQQEIVDYVRRGGTLLVFPARPPGKVIGELWKDAPSAPDAPPSADSAIRAKWAFGGGEVIESSKDFYSWISLNKGLGDNRAQEAFPWARGALREFLEAAGVQPALKLSGDSGEAPDLIASEIVTNEGTGLLGNRTNGQGFLSVTNISEQAAEAKFEILSPSASARGTQDEYSRLDVMVPARESLLLPLSIPVCSSASRALCDEDISTAGAEFLEWGLDGKTLELSFYVPARAEIHLHVSEKPSRVALDETDVNPDSTWTPATDDFRLTLPRGAAPNFRRTIKLDIPNAVRAEHGKKNKPSKAPPEDVDCYVVNAVRFPTSGNAFLRTVPALIVPDADQKMNVLLMTENRNESASGSVELSFDKPLHGTKNILVPARGTASELIDFRQAEIQGSQTSAPSDHLFHAAIEVRVGRDHRVLPLVFLLHSNDAQEHYRFDFDRDGADEWVLENDRLRLIVSPESGGRAIALMDKLSGGNLSTSVGLFRDSFSFTENPPGISEARRRGRYGLFNRPYSAEWGPDSVHPVLKLHYDAPDVYPAGAAIEKTMELEGADTVHVSYRIALRSKTGENGSGSQSQSFVALNSFPAEEANGSSTRFCWQNSSQEKTSVSVDAGKGAAEDPHCEDFVRDGKEILVPEGVSQVEIRSASQPRVEVSWDCAKSCGRLRIEPKYFSALFRLEFPPLAPGAETASYSIRIHVVSPP